MPLSLPGSGRNRSGVRADGVLQAPEAGLPVLMVEADNCTESAAAATPEPPCDKPPTLSVNGTIGPSPNSTGEGPIVSGTGARPG
ncbi:hypothetical protein ACIREM_28050 [Streptomyces shenzhenensis]|uniref:hypothetical protein n=1 Tax=Streptomyces shenzhenensis TaxID=943815 RepID=UPI00382AD893